MKNKKDISDLIRDNQHKLDELPSDRTWKRLESRLENRRNKGNSFLYRQLAMAAAVIALVAVISLFTVLADQQQNDMMAKVENASPLADSWGIQNLETIYTDANNNVRKVIEFQKELKVRYANPIKEGSQAKKLLTSNKTFTGKVNRPIGLAEELIAKRKENETTPGKVASNIKPSNLKFSTSKAKDVVGDYLSLTQQMEWILGTWVENGKIVEWQKVNKSTILCDDFVLKEKKNKTLQLTDVKSNIKYILTIDNGDKKTFSNDKVGRVILEKMNPNSFSLTFLPHQGVKKKLNFAK